MALNQTVAPLVEPIGLEEIKGHLRIDIADDDIRLEDYISAARNWCEDFQARQLLTATWQLKLDAFPDEPWILVPLPPLQSVTSIQYLDQDNVLQTLPTSDYLVDAASEPGRICPAPDVTWPVTYEVPNAITITFKAGYGDDPSKVPHVTRHGLRLLIGHWHEHRESVVLGTVATKIPKTVESCLWPNRFLGRVHL